MFGRYATLSFELDKKAIKHIKEKSVYNHNYYALDLTVYGDYIIPGKCNILYEESDDFSGTVYYSLGYFEDDKFNAMFTWLQEDPADLNIIM